MSKVAVSFTHIIKSAEPAFSVLVSRFILGESFPLPVYFSLLPIIGGCALAAVTELNFNMIGMNCFVTESLMIFFKVLNLWKLCYRIYGSYDIEFSIRVS